MASYAAFGAACEFEPRAGTQACMACNGIANGRLDGRVLRWPSFLFLLVFSW